MIVRTEINLAVLGPAGTEYDVDADDPQVQALLNAGLVSEVEHRLRLPCLMCSPPSFWDSEEARDVHVRGTHGDAAGEGGRTPSRRTRRDGDVEDPGAAGQDDS